MLLSLQVCLSLILCHVDMNIKEKTFCYDSDSDDPYAGEHFRMYEFKIRRCTRSRSHDWTDCPFSHPGEKARRRDPLRYRYTGEVCPEFRHNGDCSSGEECGLSHGVFECWLHPSRYRTKLCKDGKYCKRKVCFFAHFPRQLRVFPPENFVSGGNSGSPATVFSGGDNQCCMFSQHSPTSTLLGFSQSPSLSPPLSPANKAAAFSRLCRLRTASVTYNEAINELISSLDSVSITGSLTCVATAEMIDSSNFGSQSHRLPPWIDAGNRDFQIKQSSLQFVLSPSTSSYLNNGQMQPSPTTSYFSDLTAAVRAKISYEVSYCGDPDVQWVNDLLT